MVPPEKITDTQIGVATWLLLWWTVSGYAGSFVTMGLHQHADLYQQLPPRPPARGTLNRPLVPKQV